MSAAYEVWLYGSRARGDADDESDTDVLVIADEDVHVPPLRIKHPRISFTRYSWAEIGAMAKYGSLFLLHLRLEGEVLYPGQRVTSLYPLLATLPEYARVREDQRRFRQAIDEAAASIVDGGWPDFECEVAAGVARHAAILGCYLLGRANFAREQPFHIVGRHLDYPTELIEYLASRATKWRKHLGPPADPVEALDWLMELRHLLVAIEGIRRV